MVPQAGETHLDLLCQATIGNTLFRFWGWNNEVHVFETRSGTWSHPETQVGLQGRSPLPTILCASESHHSRK